MGIFSWFTGRRDAPLSINLSQPVPLAAKPAIGRKEGNPGQDNPGSGGSPTPKKARTKEGIEAIEASARRIADLASTLGMQRNAHDFEAAKTSADHAGSRRILLQFLERCKQDVGADHPSTAIVLEELGTCSSEAGGDSSWQEMETSWQSCLRIREMALAADHPDTLRIRHMLGTLYMARSRHAESIALLGRNLQLLDNQDQSDFFWFDQMLSALAISYRNTNAMEQAETCWRRLQARREARRGSEHPETLQASGQLAAFLIVVKRHDEALAVLLRNRDAMFNLLRRSDESGKESGESRMDIWNVTGDIEGDLTFARTAYSMANSFAQCSELNTAERMYQLAVSVYLMNRTIPPERPFARLQAKT